MTEQERVRFRTLWDRKTTGGELTTAEEEELAALVRRIEAAEAVYLKPANERLAREAERIEAQNLRLQELLARREAFITRLNDFLEEARRERAEIAGELERVLEAA